LGFLGAGSFPSLELKLELDEEDERQVQMMLLQQQRARMLDVESDDPSSSSVDKDNDATMIASNIAGSESKHAEKTAFPEHESSRGEGGELRSRTDNTNASKRSLAASLKSRVKKARNDVVQEEKQSLGLSLLGEYSSGQSE
jgi:hypothetical protein